MNVLETHSKIIRDYASYIRSFINIADEELNAKVMEELEGGKLWPEPLLQFNPPFAKSGDLPGLVKREGLHSHMAHIFSGYSLYQHQVDAIQLGVRDRDFVVTSGTGSGKSLTYMATIFNHLLNHPDEQGVVAIVVYPLNALINSQTEEFTKYKLNFQKNPGGDFPIDYGQYTGQEDEGKRRAMLDKPPRILLTNYMMLELLLTRVKERPLRDAIYSNLRYLVFDELHTYRGRQGADVALLIRRIQSRCSNPLTCIGTSATMVSGGSPVEQDLQVATVASTLFGREFLPEQIIRETLEPTFDPAGLAQSESALSAAIRQEIDLQGDEPSLRTHPVAAWLEHNAVLEQVEGIWQRRRPQRVADLVEKLAQDSGETLERCESSLRGMLNWISALNQRLKTSGRIYTLLPFRVHQFISQTGSVYTTLEPDHQRHVTLEPGMYREDAADNQPIFSNVFSRISGQAFLCVQRQGEFLVPREFHNLTPVESDEDEGPENSGYLLQDPGEWRLEDELDLLPDTWFNTSRQGRRLKREWEKRLPRPIWFDRMGRCSDATPMEYKGLWVPAPLLLDPTCGTWYESRQTKEGTKLTKLGSEGRSTSTTILTWLILRQLEQANYALQDQKLLSFTDNRQDAALQSGHFNDFIQVVRLRAALHKALESSPTRTLDFTQLGEAVFKALALPFSEYTGQKEEPPQASVRMEYETLLRNLLVYRLLEDLGRSWRIVLPNLEQCALLEIGYKGLDELATNDSYWQDLPGMGQLDSTQRTHLITTILEHFRLEFALHSSNFLEDSVVQQQEMWIREKLKSPWSLETDEHLPTPGVMRYDPISTRARIPSHSYGPNSGLAKYIRKYMNREGSPDQEWKGKDYQAFIEPLMQKLVRADLLHAVPMKDRKGADIHVYRLKVDRILWHAGDGITVKADPVKRRSTRQISLKPNAFFQELYRTGLPTRKRLFAGDHTGQLDNDTRKTREKCFKAEWKLEDNKTPDLDRVRTDSISALFCSPTMELGIDIGGLSVVHMRNAPPNPSNYAQRSGRAGRSGQGALVFTYCSTYSAHDRHYFAAQSDLVAGAVQPPRLDLCNEDLLRTHLYALTLSEIGLPGLDDGVSGRASLLDLVVTDNPDLPLKPSVREGLSLTPKKQAEMATRFLKVLGPLVWQLQENASWYREDWCTRQLESITKNLDQALERWRLLKRQARAALDKATQQLRSGTLIAGSKDYKNLARQQSQATRQENLLDNQSGNRPGELSEFYPWRYLASEGFLPGYNFTRLPLRIFIPSNDTSGDFISRPRAIALREFGPRNLLYHKGRKYRVERMLVQDAADQLGDAKVCTASGYFLSDGERQLELCPFSGADLSDTANCTLLNDLLEMGESKATEVDRISCEEEERVRQGFKVQTWFKVEGGMHSVRKARVLVEVAPVLSLKFIPAARLVHVNNGWLHTREQGFPHNLVSGDWRTKFPAADARTDAGVSAAPENDAWRRILLKTSNASDAIYIEPLAALGLNREAVITLQYALKRAVETVFQVESNEIAAVSMGRPDTPNILLYESAEGSLGVLSQLLDDPACFRELVQAAWRICRFDDPEYHAKASYSDLLSYYNQAHHAIIDRFLIKDALGRLQQCGVELSSPGFSSYEDQYERIRKASDATSETEKRFLDHLYKHGLRLPDAAQKQVPGVYCQPDFYYEPRFWVFCDGKPHDRPEIRERDHEQRQAIREKGDEVWVYHYMDDLAALLAARPDIFRKVR